MIISYLDSGALDSEIEATSSTRAEVAMLNHSTLLDVTNGNDASDKNCIRVQEVCFD